jgi:hypothetical protein
MRHVNPKTLSVVPLLMFKPTRYHPSRSLSTNTSSFSSLECGGWVHRSARCMCGRIFLYSVQLNGELFPGRNNHPLGPALSLSGAPHLLSFPLLGRTSGYPLPGFSLPRFCLAPPASLQLERAVRDNRHLGAYAVDWVGADLGRFPAAGHQRHPTT